MMKKILLITAMMSVVQALSAQYTWINPLPQGNTLNSVNCVDSSFVYACGDHGTLIRSVNSGDDWLIMDPKTTIKLNAIFFLNKDHGFIVGDSGTILVTYDAGLNWQIQSSLTDYSIKSVFFKDNLQGICCGSNGIILSTLDGGQSWETISSGIYGTCFSIDFINEDTGYIAGGNWDNYGFILKTEDGGSSWSYIIDSLGYGMYAIDCSPNKSIFVGGENGILMKSLDEGMSWDTLIDPTPYSNFHIMTLYSSDTNTAYFGTIGGDFGKTINGGMDWEVTNVGNYGHLHAIDQSSDRIIIVGFAGGIYYENELSELVRLNYGPSSYLHSIDITDPEHIFITGSSTIIKSKNTGLSWTIDTIPELEYCIDAQFVDSLTGYALLGWSVMKTTDGGKSWEEQSFSEKADFLNGLHMIDQNTGFVFGGGYSPGGAHWGTLIKTVDGTNWNSIYCPGGYPVSECYFVNKDKGFVMNFSGQMYLTTDAGNSWSSISLPVGSIRAINDMLFINDMIGFAAGDRGQVGNIILKTINGGDEWKVCYEDEVPPDNYQLRSIDFLDSLNGYATGTNGAILKTHNGGSNWSRLLSFTNNILTGVVLLDDSAGFLIGSDGTLASFGEPGLGTPDFVPSGHLLTATYPNPFTDNISIDLYSDIKEMVFIRIYDLNGRLMYMDRYWLKDGKQTISITPGEGISNGVYILSLDGRKTSYSCRIVRQRN